MTYRQLGERLRRGEGEEGRLESRLREEGRRGQAALRCIVGERSRIENAGIAPRNIDFDTCSYEDLADYALPSERREMWVVFIISAARAHSDCHVWKLVAVLAGNKLYCLAIGEPQQQARTLDVKHFAAIMVSSLMSVRMSWCHRVWSKCLWKGQRWACQWTWCNFLCRHERLIWGLDSLRGPRHAILHIDSCLS